MTKSNILAIWLAMVEAYQDARDAGFEVEALELLQAIAKLAVHVSESLHVEN